MIEYICELSKVNELLALRCLKKAAEDRNIHYSWEEIQETIVEFLEELSVGLRSEGGEIVGPRQRNQSSNNRGQAWG